MTRIFTSLILVISAFICQGQEGAFNVRSGDTLTNEQWKAVLPDQFDLFDIDTPLELIIESDFKKLKKEKNKDDYQKAILHYQLNDSIIIKRKIRIKSRGAFRKSYCYFPPLRLNFKKTDFFIEDLRDLEKMKMVTHCRSGDAYQKYLLREHLVYRLFNLFTDMSFKTRLLKVTYVDTGRKNKTQDTWAFLIEEHKKLAARHGAVLLDHEKLGQQNMEDNQMDLVALFEYMIGNTDWSVPGQHNMKLLKFLDFEEPKPYPVPYDFDYSGFVNTTYAIPPEALGIDNVRDRFFLGYCRSKESFQKVFNLFLEKEAAIYATINDFAYLDKKDKLDMVNFIEEFYEKIKSPRAAEVLLKECKRPN